MNEKFCEMQFLLDQNGQEILLKDGQFQVMMEWEKPYMEACIDALEPKGDVLEVGFGCGYSADHIQKYCPRSHTIIEYHPVIAAKARKWAEGKKGVVIIEDTWQKALPRLGIFDTIFFDDYPLESGEEIAKKADVAESCSMILQEGQKILTEIERKLPKLKTISYTKKDLEAFFLYLKKEKGIDPAFYLNFIFQLKSAGSITEELLEYALDFLKREKMATAAEIEAYLAKGLAKNTYSPQYNDRLFQFLELCLQNHMRKDANFSCYLEDPSSKFEDDRFFQKIIMSPTLSYKEHAIPIQVPKHCKYYKADTALVITIKKMVY